VSVQKRWQVLSKEDQAPTPDSPPPDSPPPPSQQQQPQDHHRGAPRLNGGLRVGGPPPPPPPPPQPEEEEEVDEGVGGKEVKDGRPKTDKSPALAPCKEAVVVVDVDSGSTP